MTSKDILLENIKNHYKSTSIRNTAKAIGISPNIILNWSANRSFPSLNQIDYIGYILNIEPYLLIKEETTYTIDSDIWREGVQKVFLKNVTTLRSENDIQAAQFNNDFEEDMSYRNFSAYINGDRQIINTRSLDKIAKIFSIKTYKLLERGV